MQFAYILDRIRDTPFSDTPFRHLEIDDLFRTDDFEAIVRSEDVAVNGASSDDELFKGLFAANYRIVHFPGCTEDYREYIQWHRRKATSHKINTSCEGYGVVLRLQSAQTDVMQAVADFFNSPEFVSCIAEKFGIDNDKCVYDAGIQKYLDGYEISPHPDIRRKALTYMISIHPDPRAEESEYHTSYLQFRPQWKYVEEFWKGNEQFDRCWVPWDWCEIKKQQRRNNSIVIFSPSNNTIHAVKANYDHLRHQRTQIYGNLWHRDTPKMETPKWEDVAIYPREENMAAAKPTPVQAKLHSLTRRFSKPRKSAETHADRNV